jgi:ribA/ribD-fused uncharacterized protein
MNQTQMNQTILIFYSKSANKKPGYGAGESLNPNDDFSDLSKIEDWRKILSNFHYSPFIWKDREWSCIEEAYQAAKFGPENYDNFQKEVRKLSVDIKNDCGLISRKLRKWKILTKEQLNEWDNISRNIMEDIAKSKYKYSTIGKKTLLATKNATLLHFIPRSSIKYDHFKHLENIREEIRNHHPIL